MEPPENQPGTRHAIPLDEPCCGLDFVFNSHGSADIGSDSVNVELDNGGLSFVAQEEVAGAAAVHKSILCKTACTDGVTENVEGSFLICVAIGVIEAHPMTGQVLQGSLAEIVCENITGGLARRCIATPAFCIVPFVAASCSIHVDGNKTNVPASQFGANEVDSLAALRQGNVFVFWNQEFGIKTEGGETGHNTAGNLPVVGPFKETTVRTSFTRCFTAVSVVD